MMAEDLTGKVVLVTGGGRGIGRATALVFARAGADVIVAARTRGDVNSVAREVRALGVRSMAVTADVSSAEDVHAMMRAVNRRFGGVDVLVNNAAIIEPIGPIWETSAAAWRKTIRVNVDGVQLCTLGVLNGMMERQRGVIINVSSGAARNARYGWSAYCASKAAVDQLTRVTAVELEAFHIRVNAVYPGIAETGMQELIRATPDDAMGGDVQRFRDRHAQGLNFPPELPAQFIFWVAQQADLTGQLLDLNDKATRERAGL